MNSVDPLLDRVYSDQYHCVHFVIEAARHLYGQDWEPRLPGLQDRQFSRDAWQHWQQIDQPQHGCLVLLSGGGTWPHVGIYHIDRLLHLTRQGPRWMPLDCEKIGFTRVRFYK